MSSEIQGSANVRNLILAYENQKTLISEETQTKTEQNSESPRYRTKSIGNLFSFANIFRRNNSEITSINEIEKDLVKIDAHLHYYQEYNKEAHVAFQEEIFNVLTSIVIIDSQGSESISQKKKELVAEVQRLVAVLNKKLPYGGGKHTKIESTSVKSYEIVGQPSQVTTKAAVVISNGHSDTSTKVKTQQTYQVIGETNESTHKTVLLSNGHSETSPMENGTSKTEVVEKTNLKYVPYSQISETNSAINDIEPSLIPSVSKLKQRFQNSSSTSNTESFVTSASYSGISRSQSMRVTSKSSSEVRVRRERSLRASTISSYSGVEEPEKKESSEADSTVRKYEDVKEEDEGDANDKEVYVQKNEESVSGLVSVFKLRNLFEHKSKETDQGLGLLSKNGPLMDRDSDYNIPYTQMSLGAFRLKRTISGNYLNYAGLLRTTSRSKSINDLNENLASDSKFEDDKWLGNQDGNESPKDEIEEYNDDTTDQGAEQHSYATVTLKPQASAASYLTTSQSSSSAGGYQVVSSSQEATVEHSLPPVNIVRTTREVFSGPWASSEYELKTLHSSQTHHTVSIQKTQKVVSSATRISQNTSRTVVEENPVAYSTLSYQNGEKNLAEITNGEMRSLEEDTTTDPRTIIEGADNFGVKVSGNVEIKLEADNTTDPRTIIEGTDNFAHNVSEKPEIVLLEADTTTDPRTIVEGEDIFEQNVSENVDKEFDKLVEASDIQTKSKEL